MLESRDDSSKAVSSAPQQVKSASSSSQHCNSSKPPQLPHANTFPCTPGTRLPLEDLIGNLDEQAKRAEPTDYSPEEHVGWIPNSSSTLLTPNRKRKRARSSSPSCPNMSSQRQENSALRGGPGADPTKRTPDADPATDLWQRYAIGKENIDSLRLPCLDQLVFHASPRPAETPVKSTGLRRSASTGNDWPSSKNKRQKISTKMSIALWQDQSETDPACKSKVAAMVEKIQESLTTQKLAAVDRPSPRGDCPSSSSPLPETHDFRPNNAPSASPLQAREQQPAPQMPVHDQMRTENEPMAIEAPLQPPTDDAHAADDGVQVAISMPEPVKPAALHLKSKAPLPAFKRPSITRGQSSFGRQYPVKAAPEVKPPAPLDELDEFGDAFDMSVEDLDELVSQVPRALYDIPQHPPVQQDAADNCATHDGAAAPRIDLTNDAESDEFGDDEIDEASLAQVEFSMTQAYRASHPSSNVRTR